MNETTRHRGVAATDPRNAGPIAYFRPKKPTREQLLARFEPYYRTRGPAALAAKVEALQAAIEKGPVRPDPPLCQPLETVADPVNGLGTHPDIVFHMWKLDSGLPTSCRYVFFGGPALVHPETGVVFAVGYGTVGYVLRLPPDILATAGPEQLKVVFNLAPHLPSFDISDAGPAWRFVWRDAPEAAWVRAAYDFAGRPGS